MTTPPQVLGHCHPAFTAVADQFAQLLAEEPLAGAGLCLYHRGERVLDLCGGLRDRDGELPWQADTLVNVFSASKAFVAAAVLLLEQRGQLKLSAPVADYWPEFARSGKGEIRIEQVLNHTAGLAAFGDTIPDEDLYDWDAMVAHVEAMAPNWPPGSRQGYQVFSFGWILGELIRRVTGQLPGDFIHSALCQPLGLDFHIGLDEGELARVADVAPMTSPAARTAASQRPRASADDAALAARAFSNPASLTRGTNGRAWRCAQIPAANGHGTAASLAGLYRGLIGGELLDADRLPSLWTVTTSNLDAITLLPTSYSLGLLLARPGDALQLGLGPHCFGHPGAGGSLGFADPDAGLAFGFVTRNLGPGLLSDDRAARLIDAVYRCL